MYNYVSNGKENWPYEAIYYPNWNTDWDINPIIYDNAVIELNWDSVSYVLCYKISRNILWMQMKYADIINEQTWEIFSFQVSNIFLIKVINDDIKVLAKIWDELKYYEDFWKTEYTIESDWDKKELTPLWYYNMFVRYDDDYYYPLIVDSERHEHAIRRFWDYYWYKSYIDDEGVPHLLMLIEDENEDWYWTDNFEIFTQKIYFSDDIEEIETWDITPNWDIYMETNYNKKYHLDNEWKVVPWMPQINTSAFSFTRVFEDTDTDYIVWKNERWYFIISRMVNELSDRQRENIKYFHWYCGYTNNWKWWAFLMVRPSREVVLVDKDSKELFSTDLEAEDKVKRISLNWKVLEIELENWDVRKYL